MLSLAAVYEYVLAVNFPDGWSFKVGMFRREGRADAILVSRETEDRWHFDCYHVAFKLDYHTSRAGCDRAKGSAFKMCCEAVIQIHGTIVIYKDGRIIRKLLL